MAFELGLNQPLPPGCDERECLNRTRTWLTCFCVNGSYATQFGKMSMIPLNDQLARNSRNWYRSSPLICPFDIHLCAHVDILLLFADFQAVVGRGSLQKRVSEVILHFVLLYITINWLLQGFDVVFIAIQFDEKLSECGKYWVRRFAADPRSQRKSALRQPFSNSY
jgi:transcriptional regulatory protein LEU3